MRSRKKICIISSVSIIVVLGALFFCISSHGTDTNHEKKPYIIKNGSKTEEEKLLLEQNYVTEKIEDTLNGYAFESDEEKQHYREIFSEYFQD